MRCNSQYATYPSACTAINNLKTSGHWNVVYCNFFQAFSGALLITILTHMTEPIKLLTCSFLRKVHQQISSFQTYL
jgi:hypothetical protein